MVDTSRYKSIAIKIPYYDALVKMGLSAMRGPGQQMMHLIRKEAENKGILIGCPVTYAPSFKNLENSKVAGTSIDDRAGCSVILEVAKELKKIKNKPNVYIVFSTQEEFNLRGVLPMANTLLPDIAVQLDIMLSSDTPDMQNEGDIGLGKGPCMSLYSFHGRGTLNGLIPNQALVNLFASTAKKIKSIFKEVLEQVC